MVKTSEMSMELKQELAFTKEELAELEAAKKMPITFDADCPETTPERAVKFRRLIRRVTEWMPMEHNHNQEKNV